jgi:hypothetical protein
LDPQLDLGDSLLFGFGGDDSDDGKANENGDEIEYEYEMNGSKHL